MQKSRRFSFVWWILVVVLGVTLGLILQHQVSANSEYVEVYTASKDISVDTQITKEALVKTKKHKTDVPSDAVTDLDSVVGLYASSSIAPEQVLQKAAISDAKTLREVVRRYGMQFGALTIPVDQSDFTTDQIHMGDTVDIIGVFGRNSSSGTDLVSQYVAENVPVLNIIEDTKTGVPKMVIAVSREDALKVARDLSAGKIRIMLDPRQFDPQASKTTTPLETPVSVQSAKDSPNGQK